HRACRRRWTSCCCAGCTRAPSCGSRAPRTCSASCARWSRSVDPMSFGGELRTFDVFDLVGWLMGRKRAGILQMTRRSTQKRLVFGEGRLQWASSNDPRETIGQALVRDGLIGEEVLFRALLKQEAARDKRRLGEILIADGLLREPQLMRTLRGNAEAHLYD